MNFISIRAQTSQKNSPKARFFPVSKARTNILFYFVTIHMHCIYQFNGLMISST